MIFIIYEEKLSYTKNNLQSRLNIFFLTNPMVKSILSFFAMQVF